MDNETETGQHTRPRPTLKTVAEASGLAVTTVSRALGDAPDISEKTKKKVREIARQLGYVPNRAGVRLRTGRTNVIALVLPTEEDGLNMTPRLISAIADGVSGSPFHLVVIPEAPQQDLMDPIRYIVETRSADAIIFNRIQPQDPRVDFLIERGVPFVTHGRSARSEEHAYFDYDNEAFGRIAVETLAERGRKSLLLLAPPQGQSYGLDVARGVTNAAEKAGISVYIPENVTSDHSAEDIKACIRTNLEQHGQLDGLIVSSPSGAMNAAGEIEAFGHEIGKSFDILAKETFPILNLFRPEILALKEDISEAGHFLAKAAIYEITNNGQTHQQRVDQPTADDLDKNT